MVPTNKVTRVNNKAAVPPAVANQKRYISKRHQKLAENQAYHRQQKEQKETAAKHIKEIAIIESPNARRQEEGKEAAAKQIKEIAILESPNALRSGRIKRSTRSTGQTATGGKRWV